MFRARNKPKGFRYTCLGKLANPLLRLGAPIGVNVEKGQASQAIADFVSKYSIVGKEVHGIRFWLRLLASTKLVPTDRLMPLADGANSLLSILAAIIKNSRF
ncbi:four helix bundle protein [Rhodopirellula baltica]|uniref:four helix bundle protein n=1 Tax=Rhodopirellula baltica TaxID=265606 RepID=UPI0009D9F383